MAQKYRSFTTTPEVEDALQYLKANGFNMSKLIRMTIMAWYYKVKEDEER